MKEPENPGRRKIYLRLLISLTILGMLVIGISSCNFPDIGDILPINQSTEVPSDDPATPTPLPSPTPDLPLVEPHQLILWLPPQFDPGNGTEAGDLLAERLDEFVARRPQTDLQVRVKSLSGEFGMLESLQLTGTTAPLLMPNLVALPRALLEDAFRYDLVVPLDEYLEDFGEGDWYEYALDLARIDDQIAGIPFAGDLMVMAYKENGELPPTDWSSLLGLQRALSFPASDSHSLVTLAWYQSLGGELRTEEGEPALDGDLMLEVLNFYKQAQEVNLMPYWLTQFETAEQAWASYLERQSSLSITWTSQLLGSESPNTILAAMPTKDARAFTYADGWVWVIVPSNSEDEEFALELADYLTESDFLSSWSFTGGYLPVRQTSLASWSEESYYSTLEKLLPAAVLVPDAVLESELGPPVRDAVVDVLKSQVEPEEVLETLLEEVLN